NPFLPKTPPARPLRTARAGGPRRAARHPRPVSNGRGPSRRSRNRQKIARATTARSGHRQERREAARSIENKKPDLLQDESCGRLDREQAGLLSESPAPSSMMKGS